MKSTGPVLVVHDIRSAENVGSLFRTADAIGIQKIYLSSICPHPIDRFGRPVRAIAKTALGAELCIPWEVYTDITDLLTELRTNGYTLIAIEQSPYSIDYKTLEVPPTSACIIGNEVTGIAPNVLSLVDHTLEIPMRGTKESLNVSVAAGIVLFRLFDR